MNDCMVCVYFILFIVIVIGVYSFLVERYDTRFDVLLKGALFEFCFGCGVFFEVVEMLICLMILKEELCVVFDLIFGEEVC